MEMPVLRDRAEVMRDEMVMRPPILALLEREPHTIPELAVALGKPSWEVVLWVMAMWRYGLVEELPKPRTEDYFRYRAKGTGGAS